MKRMLSIAIAAACAALGAAATANAADPGAAAAAAPMTSTKTQGEVSILVEPRLAGGELILKVVALNRSQQPAAFGPEDIEVSTADGKAVPVMSLDALIAQAKADAETAGTVRPGSYNSSYTSGPATTRNQFGQPDVHNFSGNSAPLGGQINPEAPVEGTQSDGAAVEPQIASLKAAILQDIAIPPGEVKGGEVVAGPIRFHWREKHTLRIEVRFNGERHEFELPAPAEQ